MRAADPFYRNHTEREEHEAFWTGYAHALDDTGADVFYLRTPFEGNVHRNYLDGDQNGFYDRKRRETHSRQTLTLGIFRGASRRNIKRLGMPWWANYTRGGKYFYVRNYLESHRH